MPEREASALRGEIEAEARRLGFELVGVTTPDAPEHYAVFERWLEAGRHGEMDYLANQRSRRLRADPRQVLPECLSILVLGARYPAPSSEAESEQAGLGRVAAYAWGEDYHDVLAQRMRSLVAFIESRVGRMVPNHWYTDTGPLLERDLAQRAGLGWIGKNTCLIAPGLGSYFFLAEILLGLDLEPEAPFTADYCGSCTRCLEACPTGCILPDRTIDSRRCISYLTIELRGPIPPELRPQMGDWVFGCDICQEVCPWNRRFAPQEGDAPFAPRPGLPRPDLAENLSLGAEQFNRQFKDSPLRRTKRRGYLRNSAVALGNLGDPSAVPALAKCLKEEPEPLARGHAAWALGRIGGEAALTALQEASRNEKDAGVLDEIREALEG
jgi:epoxyqueuosine reductase